MEVTKYAEQKVIYINFGNPEQSEKVSEEKQLQEQEQKTLTLVIEREREIYDRLSVISATLQMMEDDLGDQSIREEERRIMERICRNTQGIVNEVGKILYLLKTEPRTIEQEHAKV